VRARRRLLAILCAASLSAGGAVLVTLARAGATGKVTLGVVNGTANVGADHLRAGSDAFPNFSTGAFDNYYPLAHAHVDGSPSSEAAASPADTGPIGQFAASMVPVQQPQYAVAKYPGSKAPVTFGTPGGLYATASASQFGSSALGAFVSAGGAPSVPLPAAGPARLNTLLLAWRAQFLTAADAARYPLVAAANAPDGIESGTANAITGFDATTGALVVTGDAHLPAASFAGGTVKLSNVHVRVSISNDGTAPTHTVAIDVGSASVGGVPVTIGRGGVSVASLVVPGLGQTADQADAALNGALAQAGYRMTTIAPTIVDTAGQETVEAVGVKVEVDQPAVAPGVPRQFLIHQLGEVFVDSLAVQTPATPPLPTATSGSGGSTPPASEFIPGTAATPGTPGTPATPGSAGNAPALSATAPGALATRTVAVRRVKPLSLVLLYFLWQSLLIGTVASLWWRRSELEAT
jgi:hypothetical protein